METKIDNWKCAQNVSLEYFCKEPGCTRNCLYKKIAEVMKDYPNHFVYVGITYDPCYRYTGTKSEANLFESYGIHISPNKDDIILTEGLLFERAHKYDFDKMFVICYCTDENEIRNKESEAIPIAIENDIMLKRVKNSTVGRNGNLKSNQDYYFLYICISEDEPTFGYA